MKELSIAQKAKRFDMVIEKLRNFYRDYDTVSGLIDVKEELANLIPELKESEDERIRKALIRFHKSTIDVDGIKGDDVLAWLEKQGEQKITDKYNIRGIKSKHAKGKLGEMIKEMKSADKIESKFKNGQWIVWRGNCYKVNYNGCGYELVDQNGLSTSLEYGTVDEHAHLWTLQDAKDGDVLVDGNLPFIFKKIDTNKHIYAYCGISVDDGFKIESDGESGEWTWMQDIKPATEEQRDTLMKAMADTGYTFDFDKKELKKVEVEELTAFEEAIKDMMDDYRDAIDDNKVTTEEVKERAAYMLSLIPQKPAEWSEEDEVWIDRACMLLDELNHWSTLTLAKIPSNVNDIISHLKSIKDRYTWKPSEEQMKALRWILNHIPYDSHKEEISGLLEQLKKLREE